MTKVKEFKDIIIILDCGEDSYEINLQDIADSLYEYGYMVVDANTTNIN